MIPSPEVPTLSNQAPNPLPTIQTTLNASEVVDRLKVRSKRGKLAGFDEHPRAGIASVAAFGSPFDSVLSIHHAENTVSFTLNLATKLPTIFALVLVLTVWPGMPLTDSFLSNFLWYEGLLSRGLATWMWYVPTTILPLPFVWRTAINRSRASAREHAIGTVEKIRKAIELSA